MVRAWGWLGVVSLTGSLVACSMLKKKAPVDGGEDAPAPSESLEAAAAAPSAPQAANESQITRYPDEKAVDHAPLTTESTAYMRTQANGGDLVVSLKGGTEVEKIAERGASYLILADDPKDSARKLMGWVAESSFAGGFAHPAHGGTVPAGEGGAPAHDAGHDAAPPPAPGPAKPLDTRQTNGTCPAGYNKCGAACRLACKADADCGLATAHCAGGFCMGPGAASCK